MAERHKSLTIEELGSDRYPSLDAAFVAALPSLAAFLAARIRLGLDNGRYVVENGEVRLAKKARTDAA